MAEGEVKLDAKRDVGEVRTSSGLEAALDLQPKVVLCKSEFLQNKPNCCGASELGGAVRNLAPICARRKECYETRTRPFGSGLTQTGTCQRLIE